MSEFFALLAFVLVVILYRQSRSKQQRLELQIQNLTQRVYALESLLKQRFQSLETTMFERDAAARTATVQDRKSTRLNSSH